MEVSAANDWRHVVAPARDASVGSLNPRAIAAPSGQRPLSRVVNRAHVICWCSSRAPGVEPTPSGQMSPRRTGVVMNRPKKQQSQGAAVVRMQTRRWLAPALSLSLLVACDKPDAQPEADAKTDRATNTKTGESVGAREVEANPGRTP